MGFNATWQSNSFLQMRLANVWNLICVMFETTIIFFLIQTSEIQFFGATTLHTKLLKHWHEVPKENRDELRQKLFSSIIMYANGPKIVLNRLCISVKIIIIYAMTLYRMLNVFE